MKRSCSAADLQIVMLQYRELQGIALLTNYCAQFNYESDSYALLINVSLKINVSA